MILQAEEKLVYLGTESRNGKNGEYKLVRLGNPEKFENYDFFKRDDLNLDGIKQGDVVTVTLLAEKRGYNLNLNLIRVNPVK